MFIVRNINQLHRFTLHSFSGEVVFPSQHSHFAYRNGTVLHTLFNKSLYRRAMSIYLYFLFYLKSSYIQVLYLLQLNSLHTWSLIMSDIYKQVHSSKYFHYNVCLFTLDQFINTIELNLSFRDGLQHVTHF